MSLMFQYARVKPSVISSSTVMNTNQPVATSNYVTLTGKPLPANLPSNTLVVSTGATAPIVSGTSFARKSNSPVPIPTTGNTNLTPSATQTPSQTDSFNQLLGFATALLGSGGGENLPSSTTPSTVVVGGGGTTSSSSSLFILLLLIGIGIVAYYYFQKKGK